MTSFAGLYSGSSFVALIFLELSCYLWGLGGGDGRVLAFLPWRFIQSKLF